jgi:hypothetical protein
VHNELLNELARNKEFKVGFLVNIAVLRSPAKDRVRRLNSVRYGLGINGQNHVGIQRGEHVPNMVRLHKQRPLREGEFFNLASNILNKYVFYLRQCLDLLAPDFPVFVIDLLLWFLCKRHKTFFFCIESWRKRSAPPAIGEVVPGLSTGDVALFVVGPEDRTHVFT